MQNRKAGIVVMIRDHTDKVLLSAYKILDLDFMVSIRYEIILEANNCHAYSVIHHPSSYVSQECFQN
jgi:hypothetical protein